MTTNFGRIEAVTLTAPDLESAARTYRDALDQRRIDGGTVGADLAESWAAPGVAGRVFETLQPPSGAPFFLRLIEGAAAGTTSPRRTHGWAAIELTVRDADALYAQLKDDARFRVIGAPAPLPGLPQIYPMQVEGPMGEVLYLNEIRGDLPDHDLPRAVCAVDYAFIVIVGTPDLEASTTFYRDVLGFESAGGYEIPYGVINDAFELPKTTRHRLETTGVGRRVNVEIDQYPEMATPRVTPPGALPPAMAIVSFSVDDLAPFEGRAVGPVLRRPEAPYLGRRALTIRGAAGELVELIEG